MRIVVTGGAGFIGSNLCQVLGESRRHEVVAYDDLSTGYAENIDGIDNCTLQIADIMDLDQLRTAFLGADCVVHLAARGSITKSLENPLLTHHINATGTVHVLEAARSGGVGHVIVASSSSVYGTAPQELNVEDRKPLPASPYAASKLAAEAYARVWQQSLGLDTLALRFFNVYGPKQRADHLYAAVIPTLVDSAGRGVALPIHGDGLQSRDFTYVGLVVALLADAVERRVTSLEPVNVGSGRQWSILEVVGQLEAILGRDLVREHLAPRPVDARHTFADISRMSELFPEIEPVDFELGLRETVDWHLMRSRS